MSAPEPDVLLRSGSGWMRPKHFRRVLRAASPEDVLPVLREAESAANDGEVAVGFITYEAAPAFDPALCVQPAGPLPLAWFAIFGGLEPFAYLSSGGLSADDRLQPGLQTWSASLGKDRYAENISAIRESIARGETYQVNFTFPFTTKFTGDSQGLFARLAGSQRGEHSIFIETEDFAICSASPELFFELDGDTIRCRPMKGTAKRGRWSTDDDTCAENLRRSEKDRAENLMIVDMVRNDLGRVAETGSVHTARLFDIERYPTVLQMTSTIEARTRAPLAEIFRALFPSASITGAPKIQTSKIIADIESSPRGVYCGSAGVIGPGRLAKFNVAIRTVQIDKRAHTATFGTGSGIVWDSDANSEFAECLTKAEILNADPVPDFQLLETLLFDISNGWKFMDAHLARMVASARYFGFRFDQAVARDRLREAEKASQSLRARLLVSADGGVQLECAPWRLPGFFENRPVPTIPFMRSAISNAGVSSGDVFLFHKTTHRAAYERAKAACAGVEEVLLVNERGELTEGTIGNIVLQVGDDLLTPPLDSGLLPGIFRAELLASGSIREAILTPYDLYRANAAFLINSVRGWSRLAMR